MGRQYEAADASSVAELVRVFSDPQIRRLAERRAGSREMAEDALQETFYIVSRLLGDPERIVNLRAYFASVLTRVIIDLHMRASSAIPVEDIGQVGGDWHELYSLENLVGQYLHIEGLLKRLERDHQLLMKSIPGRSSDPGRYKLAIAEAVRKGLLQILEGDVVSSADWNAILRIEYPQWCGEPGLDRAVLDQRLSRARRDARDLLKLITAGTLSS
jgi:Sigma-70 region 2